jgi:hypothetical protein
MAKRTMTAEEREWEATRAARRDWLFRQMNKSWRDVQATEASESHRRIRRRFFPWRIRVERLT